MSTKFGLVRVSGAASLLGAFSVRKEKSLDSVPIAGANLIEGQDVAVELAAGTYWARYVILIVENGFGGTFHYQLPIDGVSRYDSGAKNVDTTRGPRDQAVERPWVQFNV
ncbi:MAG: hypothetical protein JWQ90_4922 [Hydrocarboniphaga sp.]|uniref:hypothetical protein n=1 Tax=Hydrocarboniphaga sp. TaxID=2033016 RepID=UPI00262165CA|nr:hypothetical protein [Hydrocarboniphaga sp.]MDB5972472.1 hypothetical protein [Hydrocarboniphaga sp.]